MTPGAQAVRPLAANQSIRMEELLSDLGAAAVSEKTADFTGIVAAPAQNPHIREWSYVKGGQKVLVRTDFFNVENGSAYARSWERFRAGKLARRIDEILDPSGSVSKRYFTLFAADGRAVKKELDVRADGRREPQAVPASDPS